MGPSHCFCQPSRGLYAWLTGRWRPRTQRTTCIPHTQARILIPTRDPTWRDRHRHHMYGGTP